MFQQQRKTIQAGVRQKRGRRYTDSQSAEANSAGRDQAEAKLIEMQAVVKTNVRCQSNGAVKVTFIGN